MPNSMKNAKLFTPLSISGYQFGVKTHLVSTEIRQVNIAKPFEFTSFILIPFA